MIFEFFERPIKSGNRLFELIQIRITKIRFWLSGYINDHKVFIFEGP
jgi:hypothetical protein